MLEQNTYDCTLSGPHELTGQHCSLSGKAVLKTASDIAAGLSRRLPAPVSARVSKNKAVRKGSHLAGGRRAWPWLIYQCIPPR